MNFGFVADKVGFRLRLAQIAAFKDFEEGSRRRFGQAPRYFGLLSLIQDNPGMPQGRLAEAIHLVRSSIVPILDKLEAEGLIQRRDAPNDRRAKGVWLTAKGVKAMRELRPHVIAHEKRLVAGMSDEERELLVRLLTRIDQNLRTEGQAEDAA
jgi:DNA-binding MarR family transcriptional regulator